MLFSLRHRILLLLSCIILVNLVGAGVTLWYTQRSQALQSGIIDTEVGAVTAAHDLTAELLSQRGYTTYFFLNGDETWLKQMEAHHKAFQNQLAKARDASLLPGGREILNEIESQYIRYVYAREQVINHYKSNRKDDGARLHWTIRERFHNILDLCDQFRKLHEDSIRMQRTEFILQSQALVGLAVAGIFLSTVVGIWLGWVVFRRVLDPIRDMATGTAQDDAEHSPVDNEVEALGDKLRTLITDVGDVQKQLDASRESLMHSEKLALVGKLAAGVAHSIRNPLTSVKMRLFSLERSLVLDDNQREDFEVVSEEISHVESIVKNFLEFARRPKLHPRRQSPSDVVDTSLRLLRHRLESNGIEVHLRRDAKLPEVPLDSDQLKEVFVNLFINACDAMVSGGTITVTEETGLIDPMGEVAVIRIADNGPGIPKDIMDKIFDPFFSTKEEGSGLGLAIARRVVEEHGGWLHVRPGEDGGAVFIIALPGVRRSAWLRS